MMQKRYDKFAAIIQGLIWKRKSKRNFHKIENGLIAKSKALIKTKILDGHPQTELQKTK